MTTFFAFLLVLGFLVFVHEFGHFIAAKLIGVRVHVFSIGFGTRLFGFKRGDTDYRISLIPLGGYVKMAGENPTEPLAGSPEEFASRSVLERLVIILAGPFMNLLWAVLFFMFIFMVGVDQPAFLKHEARIGWIEPGTVAEKVGLRPGDVILRINAEDVPNWEAALARLNATLNQPIDITIQRNGQTLSFALNLSMDSVKAAEQGLGIYPPLQPVVGDLRKGWPAEKAGLQKGDRIVGINGSPVTHWNQLTTVIHNSPGQQITLDIERNGQRMRITITPRKDEADGKGYIGMTPLQETIKVKYGLLTAAKESVVFNVRIAYLTLNYVWKVITGEQSGKAIGGPIAIAQFAGEAARNGFMELIRLMGLLSLQLGLLNLLPIPVLDGGHVVLLAVEGISRRPISLRMREVIQIIGVVVLLAIMTYVIFNDISRLFSQ
ncbi:MAG: RIP metalloprotease RseP [candidate division KSB1 bacterium]|nr:RIP metalloprotease RseP [candidate division KSB1 bacterium]